MRQLLGILRNALFLGVALALAGASMAAHAPLNNERAVHECPYEAQEARITDQLAIEPDRPYLVIEGADLDRFRQNMKWAFDIDVDADKVYFIQAILMHPGRPAVHVFIVKNGCITFYVATDAALMAEMVRRDPATAPHAPLPNVPPVQLPPAKVE